MTGEHRFSVRPPSRASRARSARRPPPITDSRSTRRRPVEIFSSSSPSYSYARRRRGTSGPARALPCSRTRRGGRAERAERVRQKRDFSAGVAVSRGGRAWQIFDFLLAPRAGAGERLVSNAATAAKATTMICLLRRGKKWKPRAFPILKGEPECVCGQLMRLRPRHNETPDACGRSTACRGRPTRGPSTCPGV